METVEQLVSFHHIQVQLIGGAPWGFTLKGGLEHGEPLIITKIEDGGKAAQCKKLKVGDELININGSALYGSRQEALILIKGSYRILKLTVRRRSVPLIRPHSWHLAKLTEPPLPPPPPPPPPCLPPADSPPLPPPPLPSAMQLHPGAYTLPWHATDNSDLSMQWGQLSRPYSSTDRSSSLGSMESLDAPTPTAQPYPDSHNSPVDSALFNNKRDSAYSSFSASSNTSDYATVPLRPGEACSMDNLLQSLGPACRGFPSSNVPTVGSSPGEAPDEASQIVLKSRSLTRPRPRPVEVKERPSSCCYEKERRGDFEIIGNGELGVERKMNPPQPPTRTDSFRATRGRADGTDKRCSSAPVEISILSCCREDDKPPLSHGTGIQNGFAESEESDRNGNLESLESYCTRSQNKELTGMRSTHKDYDLPPSDHHPPDPVTASSVPSSLLAEPSMEDMGQSHLMHSQTKHSAVGLHRHSAPEKLLATQLQLLQFNSDNSSLEPFNQPNPSESSLSSCSSQWSHSPTQNAREDLSAGQSEQEPPHDHIQASSNKWGGSRCSTPGSVFLDGEDGESLQGTEGVNGRSLTPIQHHHPWGRSVSVPGDPSGSSTQGGLSSDQILERGFEPLSAAASVDTLLEEQRGAEKGQGGKEEKVEGEAAVKKFNSSRNHRRNRRRSERFATNLRNEIQRKKAQLQKSRGPGGLLCSGETVQEEEGPDLREEGEDSDQASHERSTKVTFALTKSPLDSQTPAEAQKSNMLSDSSHEVLQTQTQHNNSSRSVQILDPKSPSFGVGIRVVEEPAPAGKARRWRWTPEHKLQPEPEPDRWCGRSGERVLEVTGSHQGVCAFTSTTSSHPRSSSCSRMEETDILPFADRMKFFEETCKGVSVSNISGLTSRRQKKHPHPAEHQGGDFAQCQTQRRYSYQGGLQQESPLLPNPVEARRQSVSAGREREQEKEREREREQEREREERVRETARQREREEEEKQREMERARLREMEWEREREERMREWERERELEREREREKEHARERERKREREREMEREKEREREKEWEREREMEREKEREKEREREREREAHVQFYSSSNFQHKENLHSSQPPTFSLCQPQNQVPQSAFYPINTPPQPAEIQQPLHPGYAARSYTPTETYPAGQQETAQLNRKYSLTERDHPSWRRDPRPSEGVNQPHQQGRWAPRQVDVTGDERSGSTFAPPPAPLPLRARAMSENDLQRWLPSVSVAMSQTLSEVEEGMSGDGERVGSAAGHGRKKTPPPPRPPPPKWEQFHRRRASHHTLFPYSSSSSAAPLHHHPVPASFNATEGYHPSYAVPPPEMSRQRSYSLPPQRQEVSEGCPRCTCSQSQTQVQERTFPHATSYPNQPPMQERHFSVAPPSPMFSRRGFRPVAPPQREREREGSGRSAYDEPPPLLPPPQPPTENRVNSLSEMDPSHSPDQDRITARKPHKQQPGLRPGAEWERTPSPRVHSDTALPPVLENGGVPGVLPPESYFAISYEQQQQQLRISRGFQNYPDHTSSAEPPKIPEPEPGTESETTLSPSPAHSLEVELDIPMETDIDDFQEEEGPPAEDELISSELPCFALPVTVLETDIDTLPDPGASPTGGARAESGSLEEELEAGESSREGHSLEELFPPSSEGESGTESWRGGCQSAEHNTDSLDRRSGASSSCSSYYSTSAAKAQLLSQMKDFADSRERNEDDELIYKKQLMESLRKKLGVLREAQRGLQEDVRANAQLGEEVESMVVAVCKPNEVDKFRMFIGDLDKVVSLLLSLSGRLLRVETTLETLDHDAEHHERLPLLEKKRQLMRQLSEAQDLKDHVDRREQAVSRVLSRCLSPEQHRDYSHFVKMKAALLVEQKQLEDKIRLGEEQLRGLRESLGLGFGMGMGMGMSMGYGHY